MSPKNRQFFKGPENNRSESSVMLFVENVPPTAVLSILGELQNHEVKGSWFVRLKCCSHSNPPPEFFVN
jgi:hypothetical protein